MLATALAPPLIFQMLTVNCNIKSKCRAWWGGGENFTGEVASENVNGLWSVSMKTSCPFMKWQKCFIVDG